MRATSQVDVSTITTAIGTMSSSMIMSLYCFFKLLTHLPTAEEAGVSAHATEEAKKSVEEVIASQRLASARENKKSV